MPSSTLKSFAKINVGLKVISKRNDGYHNIETIFYPVSLHDEIDISMEPGHLHVNSINIDSDNKQLPKDSSNLCGKAIQKFFDEFPQEDVFNFEIFIKKNIPAGGGLAGGSSNAGAVIKFLADYFNIDTDENWGRLSKIALETGSDVPFFLLEKPCFAERRGEKMTPLEKFIIDYDMLIVNPDIHISTKDAFDALGLKPGEKRSSDLSLVKTFDPAHPEFYENDFENVVFNMHPEIGEIKNDLLENGAVFASMSGSGASVYGFFAPQDRDKLDGIKEKFLAKEYFTYASGSEVDR